MSDTPLAHMHVHTHEADGPYVPSHGRRRPSAAQLQQLVNEGMSYQDIGRHFGFSLHAIGKWCRREGIVALHWRTQTALQEGSPGKLQPHQHSTPVLHPHAFRNWPRVVDDFRPWDLPITDAEPWRGPGAEIRNFAERNDPKYRHLAAVL